MRVDPAAWQRWGDELRRGSWASDRLPFLSDEELIELLASGEPTARRYELSLVATELANRLVRFRRLVDEASARSSEAVDEALVASEDARKRTEQSANIVQDHIEVRQDEIENEPQAMRRAAQAARRTRDALEDVQDADTLLARARSEVGRHAREPEERD
ncbi:MAG TPA: hypothetical protein VFH78_12610 [Candidatus Thermoplasmatota archaeon]|nr:hypothetical protein [Candidatus Thermoplasmatota archaeon]